MLIIGRLFPLEIFPAYILEKKEGILSYAQGLSSSFVLREFFSLSFAGGTNTTSAASKASTLAAVSSLWLPSWYF